MTKIRCIEDVALGEIQRRAIDLRAAAVSPS
jgi:hypothetical protein